MRPKPPKHVWAYGVVEDRTRDGQKFRRAARHSSRRAHAMAGAVDYLLRVVVPDMAADVGFYRGLKGAIPLRNVSSRFAMEHLKASTVLPLRLRP
ncbi:MAG: Lrp/AsnC ligand binding domain-containing protein [Acetobacteraceae bacterium]